MTIVIEPCRGSDIKALIPIFSKLYPGNPLLRLQEYIDWQFLYSPWNDKTDYTLMLAKDKHAIQGILGHVPLEFRKGNRVLKGCWTTLWGTLNNSRIGLALLHDLMSRYDNRFHIGLTQDSIDIYSRYRIPVMKNMPRMLAFPLPDAAINLFHGIGRKTVYKSAETLFSLRSDRSAVFLSKLDSEHEIIPPFQGIEGCVRRTGKYLNWRYRDIPNHCYKIMHDQEMGIAIYRIEKILGRYEKVLRLVEWTFTEQKAIHAMAKITAEAVENKCVLMDFFSTSQAALNSLTNLGFIFQNKELSMVPNYFRPMSTGGDIHLAVDLPPHLKHRTFEFEKWYITKGDSDIDRFKR